jgi:DNA repair protein RadC
MQLQLCAAKQPAEILTIKPTYMKLRLRAHQQVKLHSSSDIFQILQPIFRRIPKRDRNCEHFWLMTLDTSQTIRTLELLGLGTQRNILIDPMEVYHRALHWQASSIVAIHNHPSGNLTPSRADKTVTEKLVEAGRFLNIRFLDHLIISEDKYFSFLDKGVFETLETSKFIMFNSVLAVD